MGFWKSRGWSVLLMKETDDDVTYRNTMKAGYREGEGRYNQT